MHSAFCVAINKDLLLAEKKVVSALKFLYSYDILTAV